jgi:hypothetical protein
MSAEAFNPDNLQKDEEGSGKENQKEADAIFTCQPEIKNGSIENFGDVWVILNVSQEELEDFFREGLEFKKSDSLEFPLRNDPKPMMCLRMKNSSTLLLSEIGKNSDFLLSKILSRENMKAREMGK